MPSNGNQNRRRPPAVTLISGALVVLGLALTAISWWFLLLVAAAAVGPGLLRELGFLRDQDEFQRQAAHRAGYHAYIAALIVTFVLAAVFRTGTPLEAEPGVLVEFVLVVLWFTWFLSSLLTYWGPQRTAERVLYIFGTVWLLFNIVGNLTSFVALVMQSLTAAPFFLLAWVARRWPRVAGVLLIAVAVFATHFFNLWQHILSVDPFDRGAPFVLLLFVGPLLASGIALLRAPLTRDDPDEEPSPA